MNNNHKNIQPNFHYSLMRFRDIEVVPVIARKKFHSYLKPRLSSFKNKTKRIDSILLKSNFKW